MILTIYSNTYCIMAGTNITAQTGTNIMILTFRPERFLPGTNIMRHGLIAFPYLQADIALDAFYSLHKVFGTNS